MDISTFYSRVAGMGPRGEQRACEALLFEGTSPERALRLGRKADENDRRRHPRLSLDAEVAADEGRVSLHEAIPDPRADHDLRLVELSISLAQESPRLTSFPPETQDLLARAVILIAIGEAARVDEALRRAGGTPNRARRRGVRLLILRVGGGG